MPLNRLWLNDQLQEAREYEDYVAALQGRLTETTDALAEWEHPLVKSFVARLSRLETSALENMISGPPEEIPALRERVKAIRMLLAIPAELEAARRQLEADVESALTGESA